jgi:hypothetical protein
MAPGNTSVEALLAARRNGATLREAAAAGGVHVATLCRWKKRDPAFRDAMERAAFIAWMRLAPPWRPRPRVRWRRDCPLCRARVVVRATRGGVRFWRCGRWPLCQWASWRPRAPRDCKRCGGARYWSQSRKSIGCGSCGTRTLCI